jgi:5-methylcytosine-specific restriction endonuclease McrA
MIIDWDLYNLTSRGSAKQIACKCDTCGKVVFAAKQSIVKRGGYQDCHKCAVTKVGKAKRGVTHSAATRALISSKTKGSKRPHLDEGQKGSNRRYVETICRSCSTPSKRRRDTLEQWSGLCKSCRSKEISARPGMSEIYRKNGLLYVRRFGPPPWFNIAPEKVRRGAANNKWRGGITPLNVKIRHSVEMKAWRAAVFKRDNHTCTACGKRGGDMHADHIQPFSLFPELRFELSNGRTLCVPCHREHGAKVSAGKLIKPATNINAKQ